jgi:hypothetical protein
MSSPRAEATWLSAALICLGVLISEVVKWRAGNAAPVRQSA